MSKTSPGSSPLTPVVSTRSPPGTSTAGEQALPEVIQIPPWTTSFQLLGVLVPISTPPMKVEVATLDVAKNLSATTPLAPTTESLAYGELVPMPTLLADASMYNKLSSACP